MSTKIEWTDETWNPIIGCKKVSAGCDHCYAERMAIRLAANSNVIGYDKVISKGHWNGKAEFILDKVPEPLKSKKPRRIFVCSMGDLFYEQVPFSWISIVMSMIFLAPQHTFYILTKRPERMKEYFDLSKLLASGESIGAMKNLFLGVTAENQEQANERIPILLSIGPAKKFVSCEPLLGPIDFETIPTPRIEGKDQAGRMTLRHINYLDWVICGGETGSRARAVHPDWVRSIKDQCFGARIPFFFKSWGEYREVGPGEGHASKYHYFADGGNSVMVNRIGKKRAGNVLDGQVWNEIPENNQ